MIIPFTYFVHAPLIVIVLLLGFRGRERDLVLARRILLAQVVAGLLLVPVLGWGSEHLLWSVQVPLMVLFAGSGILLTAPGGRAKAARLVLGLALLLGLAPLVVVEPNPERPFPTVASLIQVAAWGLGGELPAVLEPTADTPEEREVGHLTRNVTVPLHTTLMAAWVWIGFCLLRVTARFARGGFVRPLPAVTTTVLFLMSSRVSGAPWLDPRLFVPVWESWTGIWTSDPAALRTYGPVLVLAGALAVVQVGHDLLTRRPAARPAKTSSTGPAAERGLART